MNNSITAKRLKELREEKKLSHQKLSKKLEEQCNLIISSKQLMYYESASNDEYHTKAATVSGMAAKTLFALANFYGVSSDYLLGFTNAKTSDIKVKEISEYTGLNVDVIDTLHKSETNENPSYMNDVLNLTCRTTYQEALFRNIFYFLLSHKIETYNSDGFTSIFDLGRYDFDIGDYKPVNQLLYLLKNNDTESRSLYTINAKFWESFFLMSIHQDLNELKNELKKLKGDS